MRPGPQAAFVALARYSVRARLPLALFVAALVVRLHWNLEVHPLGDYVYSDMRGYWTRGGVFARAPFEPRPYQAFYPPGIHVLVGVVRWAFGEGGAWPVLSVLWAVFGALVPPLVYGVVRGAGGGRPAATAAGAVCVPYYPQIALGGYLLSETPFAAAVTASTLLALRLLRGGGTAAGAACGAALGIGAWIRPQILAGLPLWLLVYLLARRGGAGPRGRGILALVLGVGAFLVPAAVHLHHHTGRLGLVSENGSLNLVFGRCHATKVVANPAGPGQVRTAFSPPSLLQLAGRRRLPGAPFPQLDPAGSLEVVYDGYIGDASIHGPIVRDCVARTGPLRQLRYAAAHVWMLAYDNLMWPDSGRRVWRAPSRYWGKLVGRTLVPVGALAMIVSLGGLFRASLRPLLVVTTHLWGVVAVAAVFFGSIRLRVPYDGLLVASCALLGSLLWRAAGRLLAGRRARPVKPSGVGGGPSGQDAPMQSSRSVPHRIAPVLAALAVATVASAAHAGGGWHGPPPPPGHGGPCPGGGIAGLVFVSILGAVVIAVAWIRLAAEGRRLAVIERLLEAGREVPPALLTGTATMDLRRGIVLIAAGIGLAVAGLLVHTRAWAIGAVPVCIGLGYLASYRLGLGRTLGGRTEDGRGP